MLTEKFIRAFVRPPAETFINGISKAGLGLPDYDLAIKQHQAYCHTLKICGLDVVMLEPDAVHPDSTFVEDVAILTREVVILTKPGADSRKGEVDHIIPALTPYFSQFERIVSPGTLDGGDICEAGNHFFIGISERTNREGGQQLGEILRRLGHTFSLIPVTSDDGVLHLKSAIAYLGDGNMVITQAFSCKTEFQKYKQIIVNPNEAYAANCIQINSYTILPAGYPKIEDQLSTRGFDLITLNMSEYQKLDGGLSCLSLRMKS